MFYTVMNNRWLGTRPGVMLGCLLFIAVLRCEAQNLLRNAGFEETDSCFLGIGILEPGTGPTHWYSANGTYDHLQSCLPYGAVNGLPLNFFTYQRPYEGNSCVGLITYHQNGIDEQREWIMTALLEPLVVGQTYYCSFRANAAFGGNREYPPQIWLASDKVGMRFTMGDRPWHWGDAEPMRPDHAHVLYPQVLADTIGWTLVSGSFVADSAYRYVMVGQFFSNDLTDTLHFADPSSVFPWYPRGYTLIDEVCVSHRPNGCDLGQEVADTVNEGPLLFPNPVRDRLVLLHARNADAQMMDAVGRIVWEGRVSSERWELDVAGRARGTYILRLLHEGRTSSYKFVLIE